MSKRRSDYGYNIEDEKPPMRLQTTEEARQARASMAQPKIAVRRVEVKRGIMEAVVYPGTGSLLIETQSGIKMALTYEEARALKELLNAQLPDSDPAMKDEESNG
jgi:hypothetical protein